MSSYISGSLGDRTTASGFDIQGPAPLPSDWTTSMNQRSAPHVVTAGSDGLELTSAHVGVITVDSSAAKIDLTLPLVSGNAGLWYKVILIGTGTASDIRTASSENKMKGSIIFHTDGAVPQITGHAAGDLITFAADAVIGSTIDLSCDGTFWNVLGHGAYGGAVDKITLTQES